MNHDTDRPAIDWERFNTAAHGVAQAACRHVIHCAVRRRHPQTGGRTLDYARRVGDAAALPILIAQLTGPRTLPPAEQGQ